MASQQVGDGADLTEWCNKEVALREALRAALNALENQS